MISVTYEKISTKITGQVFKISHKEIVPDGMIENLSDDGQSVLYRPGGFFGIKHIFLNPLKMKGANVLQRHFTNDRLNPNPEKAVLSRIRSPVLIYFRLREIALCKIVGESEILFFHPFLFCLCHFFFFIFKVPFFS